MRIYAGILGQIGDVVMYSAVARRIRELFPECELTLAVSARYREAGELVAGLPYVDRLFVTRSYFERLSAPLEALWHAGWPIDPRGDDEVAEERRHGLVFETRPRHTRPDWWRFTHQVAELAESAGVPGLTNLQTEIALPLEITPPVACRGRIALHNDPNIDPRKAWSWEGVRALTQRLGRERVILLGGPGPEVPRAIDLRGKTTLAEAAAVIRDCDAFVGIDSGLMWIAASLQARVVGLYGTEYLPNPAAVQPVNRNAVYLQARGPVGGIGVEDVLCRL